jgi:hypothetical protein
VRIHREAVVQCRQTLAQLAISKNRQAEEEAEERCERACLHNPAGGVDLVIIPRPKRFAKLNKNPDGSDIIWERKRTRAEISAAADAEMLKNLKKSISRDDGLPAKGKRKAAGTADRLPAKKYVFYFFKFNQVLTGRKIGRRVSKRASDTTEGTL